MAIDSSMILIYGIPHVFSRVPLASKERMKKGYVKWKRGITAGSFAGIGVYEGITLVKDIASSKIRASAYKAFFAIFAPFLLQFVAVPYYLVTFNSKYRIYALTIAEIGAKITKGEVGIADYMWFASDMIGLGEPVSMTEGLNTNLETVSSIKTILDSMDVPNA